MTRDRRRHPRYLVPAELGLLAVTVATVYGFARVFVSGEYFLPMLVVGLYGHAVTAVTRRRRWNVPTSALVAVPGFLVLIAWLFFFDRTAVGIPTPDTVAAANEALSASWDAFQNVVAPAPALPGFVMASCAALFFAVFLADWAAFRLWSSLEAIVPTSTLFIFCSLLGSTIHRTDSALIFLAAVLGFLLLHRTARLETSAGWLTADIDRGSQAAMRLGVGLAVSALVLGIVLGPRIPGAESPALVSWRASDTGPGSRITISPLVDIQDRLLNQSDVEVFTVRSSARAYWRMTSLDTFEGDIWKSGGKYASVDGELDARLPAGVPTVDAAQSYTIENLKVLWLPAAFQPTEVTSPSADVRYQADSATLIVDTSQTDSDGLTYQVTSAVPTFGKEQLQAASRAIPGDVAARYLTLPQDFSFTAATTAERETKDAATPYDKAMALQTYFRTQFTYDLKVPKGHGESAIDNFLEVKRGYCEQFAGTFAAMARHVGLPARVAVGFTPGDADPADPKLFRVRGEHAHAWPEVYLGEYGWVAFEPTPGRGAPNAEQYTGVPEQQDASGPLQAPTTVTPTTANPATTASVVPGPSTTVTREVQTGDITKPVVADESKVLGIPTAFLVRVALVLLALVLLAGTYAAIVIAGKHLKRRRRQQQAQDASAKVRVAWEESVEALRLLGTTHDPTETREEFARRAAPQLDDSADAFVDLAHDVDAASYAPQVLTPDVAERAEHASASVITLVQQKTSTGRQVADLLDPRPLLPHLQPSTRRRAGSRR